MISPSNYSSLSSPPQPHAFPTRTSRCRSLELSWEFLYLASVSPSQLFTWNTLLTHVLNPDIYIYLPICSLHSTSSHVLLSNLTLILFRHRQRYFWLGWDSLSKVDRGFPCSISVHNQGRVAKDTPREFSDANS